MITPSAFSAASELFFPDTVAVFFFTLRAEHGHAVGELVAFGAGVAGDVGELQFFFKASVDRATVLDNFQVLDPTARFFPALLFQFAVPNCECN